MFRNAAIVSSFQCIVLNIFIDLNKSIYLFAKNVTLTQFNALLVNYFR